MFRQTFVDEADSRRTGPGGRAVRAGVIAALAAAGIAGSAVSVHHSAAQGSEPGSVVVRAEPSLVAQGAAVKISGHTALDSRETTVRITVTPPQGAAEPLTAAADAKGEFAATFSHTSAVGTYRVEAVSPSEREHGAVTFAVVSPAAFGGEVQDEEDALAKTSAEAVDTAQSLVKSLPASPPKEDLEQRLDDLKQRVAQLPAQTAKVKAALAKLQQAAETSPGIGIVYQPVFAQLGGWRGESRAQRQRFEQALARSKAAGARCDDLDHVVEALNFVSFLMTLVDRPMGILAGFAKGFDAQKLSAYEPDPGKRAFISTSIKVLPEMLQGPIGFVKALITVVTDVTQFATQAVFSHYCEKFAGPFQADIHAEYIENGKVWRNFSQEIKGRLTLRYAKAAPNQPIHISGQFNGIFTDYKSEDEALPVLFPKLARAATFFHRVILPEITGAQGDVAQGIGPGGFNVPVEGELVDRKLTLRALTATADVKDATAHVIYVVVSPLSLIPVTNSYDLPFQDAHFIITHALGKDAAELTVSVDRAKKVMTIDREFQATSGNPAVARGKYTMSVHLTNPPAP